MRKVRELLGYEEDYLEKLTKSTITLVNHLEEITTEIDTLYKEVEQPENQRSEEEENQLWEKITEAQCEWARISAILILKNIYQINAIKAVHEHLFQVTTQISEDAKVAINPANSTSVEFLAGNYISKEKNYYSTEKFPTHYALSYDNKPDDNDEGGKAITMSSLKKIIDFFRNSLLVGNLKKDRST